MLIDLLKDAILQNMGPQKTAPKNWFKSNCKLCHTQGHGKDTRHRFGLQFNPESIKLNCFNCGFSASYTEGKDLSKSFKFFLKNIQINQKFIEQIEFEIFKRKNQITIVREGDDTPTAPQFVDKLKLLSNTWHTTSLPKNSLSIIDWLNYGLDDPDFLKVVEYALSRRIHDLSKFYWTPEKFSNMNHRLIIPYYYRTKIVGFTGRLCYNPTENFIPKYFQQSPTDFVYNLDNQADWLRKYVIVNEGVLDAWCTDGVGILGEINQDKIDIINRLQKEVIVCPDRDKKGYDLVKAAIENKWAVAFPKWGPHIKDAAEASVKYGRLLTTQSIISSAITDENKINVIWAIQQNERKVK